MDTALRRIDELTVEIEPVRRQLVSFARRQVGCQALQARQYGVGWLCAVIMWAEIGDARRFSSSDQLVRFAGLDAHGRDAAELSASPIVLQEVVELVLGCGSAGLGAGGGDVAL